VREGTDGGTRDQRGLHQHLLHGFRLVRGPRLNLYPLWSELLGLGLAISCSPLHIALLLLLLLGPDPLRRGGFFVAAWIGTSVLMVTVFLGVGHGLLLTMEKGSDHRTGLDLLAAGALLALGINELLQRNQGGQPPVWSRRLDRFCALPLPALLALSTGVQIASPDDLFLYAKAGGSVLASKLERSQELVAGLVFGLSTSALVALPLVAFLLLGRERVVPLLGAMKQWLVANGDLLAGGISLGLAGYLGWQGIEGLRLG
jgi:hypothetical protein